MASELHLVPRSTTTPKPVRRKAKSVPAERDELSRLVSKLEYATEQAVILNSELADTLQTIVRLNEQLKKMKQMKAGD